jgi:biopolymer transport protein ExbD
MLSTTYSKFTEMELNLPVANAAPQKERPKEIVVSVSADGQFSVNHVVVNGRDVQSISNALAQATQTVNDPMVVVSADAQSTHQSVMMVMEAARRNQLNQLTFAAQAPGGQSK